MRYLRPTLYDLLAHRALDYFRNDERDIHKPSYAFEISGPQAFAPAGTFVKHRFVTEDSLSLLQKALLVYQDLLTFHLKDSVPDALLDLDISRLSFVYDRSVQEEKDSLYEKALRHLIDTYPHNKTNNQAKYLLAAFYHDRGSRYQFLTDTANRYDKVKAVEISGINTPCLFISGRKGYSS